MKNEITKMYNLLEVNQESFDIGSLSSNDLAGMLKQCKLANDSIKRVTDKLKDEAKTRLLKGKSVRGYQLVKSSTPRKVKDINELFRVLSEYNIDDKLFIKACSVSLPKLEDIYVNVNKRLMAHPIDEADNELAQYFNEPVKTTKKHLKEKFKNITKDFIDEGETKTSVKEI